MKIFTAMFLALCLLGCKPLDAPIKVVNKAEQDITYICHGELVVKKQAGVYECRPKKANNPD